jgi:hypothetical protein
VLRYRGFRLAPGGPCRHLEVPAGAVVLLLAHEGELRLGPPGGAAPLTARTAPVCGLRTSSLAVEHEGPVTGTEITLTPWCAYTLFGGVPLGRLTRGPLELTDLLGARAAPLLRAAAEAPDWAARVRVLDAALARLLAPKAEAAAAVCYVRNYPACWQCAGRACEACCDSAGKNCQYVICK